MKRTSQIVTLAMAALFLPGLVLGVPVDVTITGDVVFNEIADPPLSGVNPGDSVVLSFTVDSDDFMDGIPGATGGYVIDHGTFSLAFDTPVELGLIPFPAGLTPFFGLVDGYTSFDGFFVSQDPSSPNGMPLEQQPYNVWFSAEYELDTLGSLDILDALGTYDLDGLTSHVFYLSRFDPVDVNLEIEFEQITLEVGSDVPATSMWGVLILTLVMLAAGTAGVVRRRATT